MKLFGKGRGSGLEADLREATEAADRGITTHRVEALLRSFGHDETTPNALDDVAGRLDTVGLVSSPSLREADADTIIELMCSDSDASGPPPEPAPGADSEPSFAGSAAEQPRPPGDDPQDAAVVAERDAATADRDALAAESAEKIVALEAERDAVVADRDALASDLERAKTDLEAAICRLETQDGEVDDDSEAEANAARRAIEAETEKARIRHQMFDAQARDKIDQRRQELAAVEQRLSELERASDRLSDSSPDNGAFATHSESGPEPAAKGITSRATSLRLRLTRGRGADGVCAVTGEPAPDGSAEELSRQGWIVNGQTALSPAAQADGWQLPEGAALPYRGVSNR